MPTSPRVPNAATSSRRWRDLAMPLGLFGLVAAGLVGLAAATGWEDTLHALKSLNGPEIALLLGLSLINYGCRAMRWHVFAGRLGLNTDFNQNLRHFLGGFAMSVTPGRVGELVRMRWLRRETGWSFERTAPLVLVDRASDLSAMAVLLATAMAFSATGMTGGALVVALAIGGAIVVTRPNLLRLVGDIAHVLSRRAFPRIFVRVRRAATSLEAFSGPGFMVLAGVLGFVGWLAEGYAFYLLLAWLGAEIDLWRAVGIFVLATLAGGLTGAPGGLGGAEAAMVALLLLDAIPLEIAVPATLVIRVTTLWFAILIGFLVFPIAERASKKAEHALETF